MGEVATISLGESVESAVPDDALALAAVPAAPADDAAIGPLPASWSGRVAVICGPTAVGKSELVLAGAAAWGAEIVAADSMQVYRALEIGTAKPSAADRARVPHWMLDVIEFHEAFTVHDWLHGARQAASEILARGRRVVVAGGTGLYLKTFLLGLADMAGGQVAPELKQRIRATTAAAARAWLCSCDPHAGELVDLANPRRVERALEQVLATGRPLAQLRRSWEPAAEWPPGVPVVVLERPADELRRRIERRLQAMLAAGWIDEVADLRRRGFGPHLTSGQALGYRDILAHLEGELPAEALRDRLAQRTWQFARRQRTWFRHQLPGRWRAAGEDRIPSWEELVTPDAGRNRDATTA